MNELVFEVNEATVYPILSRLENKGHLKIEKRPSPLGPMRKYYFLTEEGYVNLKEFQETWQRMMKIVNEVMEVENYDNQK